jgi:hypothetical protein
MTFELALWLITVAVVGLVVLHLLQEDSNP